VTLTLTGTSTAHNALFPALGDPAGGVASVLKSGAGKWTFQSSDTKTYSGDTHITGGTLESLVSDAFSPNSNMVIDAGATLELHDQPAEFIDALLGAGSIVKQLSSTRPAPSRSARAAPRASSAEPSPAARR